MNCNIVTLAWTRHQGQATHCLVNLHSFALVVSVSLSLHACIRLSVDTTNCGNTSFRFDLLFEIPFVYLSFHCLYFWKNMLLALLSSLIECHKVVYIWLWPALLLCVLEACQANLNFAAWESDRPETSLVHLNHLLAVVAGCFLLVQASLVKVKKRVSFNQLQSARLFAHVGSWLNCIVLLWIKRDHVIIILELWSYYGSTRVTD